MVDSHVHRKSAYISRLIQRKAESLCRRASFSISDLEDLEQELWAHLLEKETKYDPSLSKFETFANRVITNKVCSIIRHRKALKRNIEREAYSLHELIEGAEDGELLPRSEATPDVRSPNPERHDVIQDVDTMLEGVDAEARRVADLLRQGVAPSRIALVMKLSRRRVAAAMTRIREEALACDLREYFHAGAQ